MLISLTPTLSILLLGLTLTNHATSMPTPPLLFYSTFHPKSIKAEDIDTMMKSIDFLNPSLPVLDLPSANEKELLKFTGIKGLNHETLKELVEMVNLFLIGANDCIRKRSLEDRKECLYNFSMQIPILAGMFGHHHGRTYPHPSEDIGAHIPHHDRGHVHHGIDASAHMPLLQTLEITRQIPPNGYHAI